MFMVVGCYMIRIWSEEIKDIPIFVTPYQTVPMTDGCWSPSRPHVFFASTTDGSISFWDLLYRQDGPVMTAKIGDDPIECLRPSENGELIAAGTSFGYINLIKLSDGFCIPSSNEKAQYFSFIDREVKREKILELRIREMKAKLAQEGVARKSSTKSTDRQESTVEELLDTCENDFFNYLEEMKKEYIKKKELEATKKQQSKAITDTATTESTKPTVSSESTESEDEGTLRGMQHAQVDSNAEEDSNKRISKTNSNIQSEIDQQESMHDDDINKQLEETITQEKEDLGLSDDDINKQLEETTQEKEELNLPEDTLLEKTRSITPGKKDFESFDDSPKSSPKASLVSPEHVSRHSSNLGSNNSALDALTLLARKSQNNSNLANFELTPRQVLSRLMQNSKLFTMKRTSNNVPISSSKTSEFSMDKDNKCASVDKDNKCTSSDEENRCPSEVISKRN